MRRIHRKIHKVKLIVSLLLLFSFICGQAILPLSTSTAASPGMQPAAATIAPEVLQALDGESWVEVLVKLKRQADTQQAARVASSYLPATTEQKKMAAGYLVVNSLQDTASAQESLLEFIDSEVKQGRVAEYESFYVVNMLYLRAVPDTIRRLAARPEVETILPNTTVRLAVPATPAAPQTVAQAVYTGLEWNIARVRAPEVWEQFGVNGEGVVVGIIDSGVHWEHEALRHKWRGYDPDNPDNPNPELNWFDAVDGRPLPYDLSTKAHGTHVLGIILGADLENENQIGVAPGAKWIAVKAFRQEGDEIVAHCHELLKAGQYMLAPTDAQGVPHPEAAPHIINCSWGNEFTGNPLEDECFRPMVQAWRDAQILPVFSTGNTEPEAYFASIWVPAGYPESMAVSATDRYNRRAIYSNQGPGQYVGCHKPDLCAPGSEIRSAVPGGYEIWSGTSMAAPHVAGAAALLLSLKPELTVDEVENILRSSALPLTDNFYHEVPNYAYGYGLVDAYKAAHLLVYGSDNVTRLWGSDRYATAVQISQAGWEAADTVVLARGDEYADALAGVPLAFQLDAPVLLTGSNALPAATREEIRRLGASKVIILGGTGAVSEMVANELATMGMLVERIGGANRFDTAARIAASLYPTGTEKAVVAFGYNFPDALAIAAYAARSGQPILLTQTASLPPETAAALATLGVEETVVAGGSGVIGDEVLAQLPGAMRISGPDRYATAVEITRYYMVQDGILLDSHLYVATGSEFADAITGAALVAKNGGSLLLVERDRLPEAVREFILLYEVLGAVIFGGKGAVGINVAAELDTLIYH